MIKTTIAEEQPLNNYVTIQTVPTDETVNGVYGVEEERYKSGIGTILGISPDLKSAMGDNIGIVVGSKVRHKLMHGIVCDKNTLHQTVIIEYAYLMTVIDEDGKESPLNDYVTVYKEEDEVLVSGVLINTADKIETATGIVCGISAAIRHGLSKHYRDVLDCDERIKYRSEKETMLPSYNGRSVSLIRYGEILCRLPGIRVAR